MVPATIIFLLLTVPVALYAGVCWLGGDRGSYQWFSYRMESLLRSLHPLLWEWLTEVWWDMDPTQVATSRNLGMRAVHNLSALVVCLGILIPASNVIRVRCDVEEKTNQELAKIRAHEILEEERAKLQEKIQRQQDFEKEHPVVTGTIKTFEYLRSKF